MPREAFEEIARLMEQATVELRTAEDPGARLLVEGLLIQAHVHALLQAVQLRREDFRLQPPISEARN